MKLLVEVTVLEFVSIIKLDEDNIEQIIEGHESIEVIVPESKQEVEIDLKELVWEYTEEIRGIIQNETDCTFVDNDRLRFVDEFEDDFVELIECFKKHSLNKIQKQQIIQSVIDQLDGNQVENLLKV